MKRIYGITALILVAILCLLIVLFLLFLAINSQAFSGLLQFIGGLGVIVVICGAGVLAQLQETDKTFGDAHFASAREIREGGFVAGPGSLIIGESNRLIVGIPEERQREHILLVATTGGGKSTGIIIPGLLQETGQRGILVNDTKGELYQKTAGALSRYMYTSIFSPARPGQSIHYNPLDHISSMEDAEDLATAWTENTGLSREEYYNQVAKLLITAAVLHIVDTEPGAPFSRLADLLSSLQFDQVRQILTKSQSDRAKSVAAAFINSIGGDQQLAGGIISGMATRFLTMKNDKLRAVTSPHPTPQRNIDFQRIAEAPEALFLNIPAADTRRLKPVTSLLIMQLMNYLTKRDKGKHFVLFLDELANAGKIPHYAEHISLVRGQGIALIQAIQNFSQLEAVYDKQDAETIIANSVTKIFYPAMGQPECERASRLLGTTTVALKSYSISEDRDTHSETVTKRPLMNPEEVRQLKRGLLIVVSGNQPPIMVQNTPYYRQPELVALADLPIAELPPAQAVSPLLMHPPIPMNPPTSTNPPTNWPTP